MVLPRRANRGYSLDHQWDENYGGGVPEYQKSLRFGIALSMDMWTTLIGAFIIIFDALHLR